VQAGINALVRMQQSYRGQAKQAANALWGSTAAHVRYKHVTVVDDDIDIHDYAAVDWAIAHRVNAGENDIVIMPGTFGLGLDPSTRRRDRNPALFGTGKWNRVLIDATMKHPMPPLALPAREFMEKARHIWEELGLPRLDPQPPWHGYSLGDWDAAWDVYASRAVSGQWEETGKETFARRRGGLTPETPVKSVKE